MLKKLCKCSLVEFIVIGICVSILLSGCTSPINVGAEPINGSLRTPSDFNLLGTQQAMQTMSSQLTKIAEGSRPVADQVTPTPADQRGISTPIAPTQTPDLSLITPTPTIPRVLPTASVTPALCNLASFVMDISIPDNSVIYPGAEFIKTWRVQNIGTCIWTTDYDLVFVSGEAMDALVEYPLPKSVPPGQMVDLSVKMKAPIEPGSHTGYWMLRNQYNSRFGVGDDGKVALWVNIKVATLAVKYSFAASVCEGTWSTPNGTLKCPGNEASVEKGYVIMDFLPIREDGALEDELSIITRPNPADDGSITGIFPKIKIETGDQFRAVVNCEYDSPGCNVTFKLRYENSEGKFIELGSWIETYDGNMNKVMVDLTPLAGQEVRFVLQVINNNTAINNRAMWILPGIWR